MATVRDASFCEISPDTWHPRGPFRRANPKMRGDMIVIVAVERFSKAVTRTPFVEKLFVLLQTICLSVSGCAVNGAGVPLTVQQAR